MVYGAIDLHLRYSQIRIVDAEGRVLRERRVVTTRERAGRRRSRAWARCGSCSRRGPRVSGWRRRSRRAGHEVIVADPNYAPMYGERAAAR